MIACPDNNGIGRSAPAPSSRRVLVIFNPVAGWRRRARLGAVLQALERRGCAVTIRETTRRGDAEAIAAAATRDAFDVVTVTSSPPP